MNDFLKQCLVHLSLSMPVIVRSPRHPGSLSFPTVCIRLCPCLPLILCHLLKLSLCPLQLMIHQQQNQLFEPPLPEGVLNVLVLWELASSPRTLSPVRSCQVTAVLPWPSENAACGGHLLLSGLPPIYSPSFFPKSPNSEPHVVVIFQPPFMSPSPFVDFCSWLIITISNMTLALICDDSSIQRHDSSSS